MLAKYENQILFTSLSFMYYLTAAATYLFIF